MTLVGRAVRVCVVYPCSPPLLHTHPKHMHGHTFALMYTPKRLLTRNTFIRPRTHPPTHPPTHSLTPQGLTYRTILMHFDGVLHPWTGKPGAQPQPCTHTHTHAHNRHRYTYTDTHTNTCTIIDSDSLLSLTAPPPRARA